MGKRASEKRATTLGGNIYHNVYYSTNSPDTIKGPE